MAFCAKCGNQLAEGSGFCGSCGAAAAGQSVTPSTGAAVQPAQSNTTSTGMTNNVAGCLSYLFGWITGLIFLLIDPYKNDKFVRFHAFQSIFFNVAVFGAWVAIFILSTILGFITRGLGFFLMGPLLTLVWIGVVVVWIICMVKAYGNQKFKLPIIGDLAEKQAG